jgi:hypothetical protein
LENECHVYHTSNLIPPTSSLKDMISKAFFPVASNNSLAVDIRRPARFGNYISISSSSNITLYSTPSIIIVTNS